MNNNNHNSGDKLWIPVEVECYSGYKAEERPDAFVFMERRWDISEITDRWYEGGITSDAPIVDYFKVKTDDGSVFILRYAAQSDVWRIRNVPGPSE